MKNAIRLFLIINALNVAWAADLPDTPTPNRQAPGFQSSISFKRAIFWPLVAACGASAITDAQLSHSALVQHPSWTEKASWLLGRRPSLGRYYATFAMVDGGGAIPSYKLLHSRHKPLRIVGWGILPMLTAIHTDDAIVMAGR